MGRADALEQARQLPHDPVRHAAQAKHKAHGHGHAAYTGDIIQPGRDCDKADAKKQQCIEHLYGKLDASGQAHHSIHRVHEALHRLAGIALLAAGVREELDRHDVRVTVHNASSHDRSRIRLLLRYLVDLR